MLELANISSQQEKSFNDYSFIQKYFLIKPEYCIGRGVFIKRLILIWFICFFFLQVFIIGVVWIILKISLVYKDIGILYPVLPNIFYLLSFALLLCGWYMMYIMQYKRLQDYGGSRLLFISSLFLTLSSIVMLSLEPNEFLSNDTIYNYMNELFLALL